MMKDCTTVTISLSGEAVTFRTLAEAACRFVDLAGQLDSGGWGLHKPSLVWRITDMQIDPASITIAATPRAEGADCGGALVTSLFDIVAAIESGDAWPLGTPQPVLLRLGALAEVGAPLELRAPGLAPAMLTAGSAEHIKAKRRLNEIGSVQGRLVAVSLEGPHMVVLEGHKEQPVRCYFDEARLEEVLAALGQQVRAHGRLERDAERRKVAVKPVSHFKVLVAMDPAERKAALEELAGIWRGDGRTGKEMLAQIRGEQ